MTSSSSFLPLYCSSLSMYSAEDHEEEEEEGEACCPAPEASLQGSRGPAPHLLLLLLLTSAQATQSGRLL